ncbi:GTP 3' 8-cyclase 2 [Bienertia sinuspersici]
MVEEYKSYANAVFARRRVEDEVLSRSTNGGSNLEGVVVAAAVKRVQACLQPIMAEALAAKYGVMAARSLGFNKIEVECDALYVVKAIKRGKFGKIP